MSELSTFRRGHSAASAFRLPNTEGKGPAAGATSAAAEPMLHQADRLRQYGSPTAPAPRWIGQSCRGGPKPATGEFAVFLAPRGSSCTSCHSQTVAPAQLVL